MPRAGTSVLTSNLGNSIVVDNGSDTIKAGFAGQELPSATLASTGLAGAGDTRPIVHGVVQDWDTMEAYWDHIFTNQLKIDTSQFNLFVTSHLFDPKDNKELLKGYVRISVGMPEQTQVLMAALRDIDDKR